MRWFDAVWEMYLEMIAAAQMTQVECIEKIYKHRFDEAERLGDTRTKYYDCAITAINMLK